MMGLCGLSVALALVLLSGSGEALREGECEVCTTFLGKFYEQLKENKANFDSMDIEEALVKSCKDARGKDNRLCYYLGATSDAATRMVSEVSRPLSHHVPVSKICEKLKKKDSQICELRYEQQLDLTSVDLKKLRVRELKKVLEDWGEACRGCAEKDDFVRRITELLPLHTGAPAPSPHSDL